MSSGRNSHDISSDEYRAKNQDDLDAKNQRSTLVVILEHLQRQQLGGAELIHLVDTVGLEAQLDELAGSARRHPERHRRLTAARQAAGLELAEADDQVE